MGLFSLEKLFGITIRESANDGSDFTNPDADYRRLFLGEDGQLHVKDSAGAVTDIGTGGAGGTGLLAVTAYTGGSDTYYSSSSTSFVDVDATNLIITFTAPSSGNVIVRLSGSLQNAGGVHSYWNLRESTTDIGSNMVVLSASSPVWVTTCFYLTGLSGGSHSYKWGYRVDSSTGYLFHGPTYGQLVMEVWEAP